MEVQQFWETNLNQINYCKRKLVKYLKRYLVNRNPSTLFRSTTGLWVYLNYWCFAENQLLCCQHMLLKLFRAFFLQVCSSDRPSEKLLDLWFLYYSAHPHHSALSHSLKTKNKTPKETNPNIVELTRVTIQFSGSSIAVRLPLFLPQRQSSVVSSMFSPPISWQVPGPPKREAGNLLLLRALLMQTEMTTA